MDPVNKYSSTEMDGETHAGSGFQVPINKKSREKVGVQILKKEWKGKDYRCKKVGILALFQVQNSLQWVVLKKFHTKWAG